MERTDIKKLINKVFQVALPLMLGAAILVWTYHGFDFRRVCEVMDGGMNYGWMLFSLVFGVFGHLFRGWRWNLALAPLGEYPKRSNSVYAIFVAYAVNLILPRVGEVSRCGYWRNTITSLSPSLWEQLFPSGWSILSVCCSLRQEPCCSRRVSLPASSASPEPTAPSFFTCSRRLTFTSPLSALLLH